MVSRYASIEVARDTYLARIDALAGSVRARHITSAPGQALVYEYKRLDAERFDADGRIVDTDAYPWVAADAKAMDLTMSEAADRILARRDLLWRGALAIEETRMRAKHVIRSAQSVREMHNVWAQARDAMDAASVEVER